MNDAGDVIAVSEPSYSGYRGRTRLLQWNGSSWVNYGNSSGYIYPYENSYDYTGYGADNTGRAISLNAAGDRIAIGGFYNAGGGYRSGFIRVYELNGSNNWAKVGSDFDGDGSSHYLGHAVSMNAKEINSLVGPIMLTVSEVMRKCLKAMNSVLLL